MGKFAIKTPGSSSRATSSGSAARSSEAAELQREAFGPGLQVAMDPERVYRSINR